jgi:nicotinic acid phosphoribosyltransferase
MEVSQQLDELWHSGFEQLKVESLYDGDQISAWETVMHITGDASHFAHLETVYLGILARRTKIASNVLPPVSIIGPFKAVTDTLLTSVAPREFPPTPRPSGGAPRHPARCRTR